VTAGRIRTALGMGLRTYRRMPVLLALLVVLPAYLLGVFAAVLPNTRVPLRVPGGDVVSAGMVEVYVALLTPTVAALVAGVAGLFLLRSTADADARLVIAGYRAREVVVARLGLVAVVAVVVTTVALATTTLTPFAPVDPAGLAAATLLGGLVYGLLGTLAGLLLDRLGGVYAVLFGSMLDMFLFQNPLVADPSPLAPWLPGHAPVRLAVDAGFSSGLDPGPLLVGLAYVAVLGALAQVAFARLARRI